MLRKREMLRQKWLIVNNMQYPADMERLEGGIDRIKAGIDELSPSMAPRGNDWAKSVEEILY